MNSIQSNLLSLIVLSLLPGCQIEESPQEKAYQFYKEGNYVQALSSINEAIDMEPDSISHLATRSIIYEAQGRYSEAINDLNKVIEFNKSLGLKSIHAIEKRSFLKYQTKKFQEALDDIDYVISELESRHSTELAFPYYYKALYLEDLNRIEEASIYLGFSHEANNAEFNNKLESEIFLAKANIEWIRKNNKLAFSYIDQAIQIDSLCDNAFATRATFWLELNSFQNAHSDYVKALKINPNNHVTLYNWGQFQMMHLSEYSNGILTFKRFIELEPESQELGKCYLNMAIAQNKLGDLAAAFVDISKAISYDSTNHMILYNYASILNEKGLNELAFQQISKAIELGPIDADYFNLRGAILLDMKNYAEAIAQFRQAIKINKNFGGAYYNLAWTYGKLNDPKTSIEFYNKAVDLNFDLQHTLVNRALQKIELNYAITACMDLRKAYELGRYDILPLIEKYCN